MCLSLSVFCNYFSNVALFEPVKPARKQNLTRSSHSRLCILGSLKSRRRTAYRHSLIKLASSLKYPSSQRNNWKMPFSTTALLFDDLSPGNLRKCPHKPYTARNQSHWPTLMVWVYHHSNFWGGLRKTHLFCNRVCIGRSRSPKKPSSILAPVERAYVTHTNLSITAVFVEYLRQFLIDLNQIYRRSSVPQNTFPWIFWAS